MDTKAPAKADQHLGNDQARQPLASGSDASLATKPENSPRRSIREMVIDNDQRFAATMKSLGE